MLFIVENFDTYIFDTCKNGKEESFFKKLNKSLTKLRSNSIRYKSFKGASPRFIDFIHYTNIIMSWESESDHIGLGYLGNDDIFKKSNKDIDVNTINIIKSYMGYLLLPKKILDKYTNKFVSNEILDNNYRLLTDIIMIDPLTNIYFLVFNLCKQNTELLYQSFIDYLNTSKEVFESYNSIDIVPYIKTFPSNVMNDCNQLYFYYINTLPDIHYYNRTNKHYRFRILI